MHFQFFSNANLEFGAKKFTQKLYPTAEVLPIVKKVELINKYKFVEMALEKNPNTFVTYITTLKTLKSVVLTNSLRTDRKSVV